MSKWAICKCLHIDNIFKKNNAFNISYYSNFIIKMILLSTILTISKRRLVKTVLRFFQVQGLKSEGAHLPPPPHTPSWFFRGQLNLKVTCHWGKQNLLLKCLHRLNQNMYFWIFTFFIMAQYMVKLVCFSISPHTTYRYILYWLPGKFTRKRASWNYAKLTPWASAFQNRMSTLAGSSYTLLVFLFINLSEISIQKMTSWNYFEL